MHSAATLRAAFRACRQPREIEAFLAGLSAIEIDVLRNDWSTWARPDQMPPPGDWTTWLLLGGRGAGKTRAGAEWVKAMALGHPPFTTAGIGRIALVGETYADVRDVMIEGVSGLLSVHRRAERPVWRTSLRRLEWANGAIAQAFSSEDPESLRGPQFGAAWSDEIAKWRHAEECWDMLQFGLRLGDNPRQVATTTPRPIPLLRRLLSEAGTVVTRASTKANAFNLAPRFLDAVVGRYNGTRLGRQELEGELIDDRADALFRRAEIDKLRVQAAPDLSRIVVAVDPPATSTRTADACGIVAAGLGPDGTAYVIADHSISGARPSDWAARAVGLYHALSADCLMAEVNQGGEMVATVIREVDASVPVKSVRATRGKYVRAEPVAA
ncbi:MAG: terminase family protein, partial [Ancalomicrobiaceae bacterium]|nr:terminase family protein [Ancalomicrobiaceae bacterium]